MNWYYVDGGQQAGPVDDATFRSLIQSGKIRSDTLVWREGMPEWLPYQKVYEESQVLAGVRTSVQEPPADPNTSRCVECGRVFSNDEMINYGTARVCAECKPVFLQKIAEGVPVQTGNARRLQPVDADALINEVLTRDYQIDTGSCITRAWELIKKNFAIAVIGTLLVTICERACGFVPVLGVFIALIIQGPLTGGLYLFFLKMLRGEPVTIGDAFSGFSQRFWPLFGTVLVLAGLMVIWITPAIVLAFPAFRSETAPNLFFWIFGALGLIGMLYTAIASVFALPLCADLGLGPWDSLRTSFRVVSQHWLSVFFLTFVAGLLSMLGLFACLVGVVFTAPILYAAISYAYEDIFGVKS